MGNSCLLSSYSLGLGRWFLSELGELDFAGGTVIHVNAGVAGLVLVYLLGNREGLKKQASDQHLLN